MGTEKCPFCGQEIDAEAAKCFFCGAKLDEESVERRLEQLHLQEDRRSARKVHIPVALGVVVAVILTYLVLFHGAPAKKPSPAVHRPPESPTVHLNAKVTFAGARFVISNNDSFDWENVKLEITSAALGEPFGLNVPRIPAGETHTVDAAEFCSKDGTPFNSFSMKLRRFRIRCDTPDRQSGSYLAGWN
jgi:hypothetical protein